LAVILLVCSLFVVVISVWIFFLGTSVSLGLYPNNTFAEQSMILVIPFFLIGLTLVTLSASHFLKKLDRYARGISDEVHNFEKLKDFMQKMDYTITFNDEEE